MDSKFLNSSHNVLGKRLNQLSSAAKADPGGSRDIKVIDVLEIMEKPEHGHE